LATDSITEAQVALGVLHREQLIDAGFVFLNRLGKEAKGKGIISGDFPDPDDPTITLNFEDRTLLTSDELSKVYRYQQQHPDVYGLHGQDLAEVRKDMLSFVSTGVKETVMTPAAFHAALARGFKIIGTDADWDALEAYIESGAAAYRADNPEYAQGKAGDYTPTVEAEEAFAREYCRDLYDADAKSSPFGGKEVRGHDLTSIRQRRNKLGNQPSPFLESGYTFGDNPDVLVSGMPSPTDPDRNIAMRVNMGTIHLAGAHPDFPGFSEMGGSNDQVYMPTGRYITELYPQDEAEREKVQEKESLAFQSEDLVALDLEIQRRAIRRAREWQAEQPPPEPEKPERGGGFFRRRT
jgi:hypothetical protein